VLGETKSYLVDMFASEWSIRCHKEVTPGCWDKGGNNSDEIVIHVSGVSERLSRGSHDRRDLMRQHFNTG
jgi:hypothetical protein